MFLGFLQLMQGSLLLGVNLMTQAYFKFKPISNQIDSYFILHTGISEQFSSARAIIEGFSKEEAFREGAVIYVCGPRGCGKSSFIRVLEDVCLESNILFNSFEIKSESEFFDKYSEGSLNTEQLVSLYQDNKIRSGVLFFEASDVPSKIITDPHALSRLLSGTVLKLDYPQEEELRPILISLLERYHLRLQEKHINEILQRVPAIPKYFELITESIGELVALHGKLKVSKLKQVLEIHR